MNIIDTSRILDRGFNHAVMTLCNRLVPRGFDLLDTDAPDTLAKQRDYIKKHGRMAVWSGGSDDTIFGDKEVNYMMRAWHDFCHLAGNHEFTLDGEIAAARMQCGQIEQAYGPSAQTAYWQRLITAEVVGQALYYDRHGRFPVDQVAFVRQYILNPEIALSRAF